MTFTSENHATFTLNLSLLTPQQNTNFGLSQFEGICMYTAY